MSGNEIEENDIPSYPSPIHPPLTCHPPHLLLTNLSSLPPPPTHLTKSLVLPSQPCPRFGSKYSTSTSSVEAPPLLTQICNHGGMYTLMWADTQTWDCDASVCGSRCAEAQQPDPDL